MVDLSQYNLHNHFNLETVEYSTDAEWLELRKNGIGGSDAAACMRLSKYMSPVKLYKIKTGLLEEDLSDNVFVKKGKALESFIRDTYVVPYLYEMGYSVTHPDVMFVNTQIPFLQANVDGIAIPLDPALDKPSDNIIIEIKWVSPYAEVNWNGDTYCGIPANYYAQVQHYMTVTGAKRAIVCALFDADWEVKYYEIPYNPTFSAKLVDECRQFYDHVCAGIEPEITPSLDKAEAAALVHKAPIKYVEDSHVTELCAEYLYKYEQAKQLDVECTKLKDMITVAYFNGRGPDASYRVRVSERVTSGVDNNILKEKYPEAYENSKRTSSFSVTSIKKV